MSHNITNSDNVFTVRVPSWHGLEQNCFDDYPTLAEARQASLPWDVVTEPVYRMVPTISETGELGTSYEVVPEAQAVVRDDNGTTLGVVGAGFEPVTNREIFEIAEALQGKGAEVKLETGGSLKGGRKVWLLLRLNEPLTYKGDKGGEVIPYFALQNAHDGSGAFRGQALMTRIVCENTSQMADIEAKKRGTEFAFRHTKTISERIDQAKTALSMWKQNVDNWNEMVDVLLGVPVADEVREDYIERFIPLPVTDNLITDRVRNNVLRERESMRTIFDSPTQTNIRNTAYGLLQGTIEWAQHYRATKGVNERDRMENRFSRAYLEQSNFTSQSVKMIREMLKV